MSQLQYVETSGEFNASARQNNDLVEEDKTRKTTYI